MAGLKWDGDDEGADDEEPEEGSVEDFDVEVSAEDAPDPDSDDTSDSPEVNEDVPENPDECQHPWGEVSREKMKRVVRGSTIDTKDIYWCDSCKTILDVIE
ncbi:hypothetical protein M199_gp275 [Halogranum tailed virus 1]|uniref:Uncharacterized protein n=1 Tax=Halogranum tailed virus 1 TaxID=1273749 RepID=R4TGN7_9CAUD|nr:hypothetical protein M199_gp275 [Halogranum tailed virus 1]AGM11391.1 hypothetical protein HGTV1_65 [Halogranum tailed virus 1]